MKPTKTYLMGSLAALVLTGCASTSSGPIIVESPVNALDELTNISIEARDELRILAKNQEALKSKSMTAEQHEQKRFQATYIPEGFDKIVDFSFVGPAEDAAMALAAAADYELRRFGDKPEVDPWVRIDIKQTMLNEALKEVGLQTGNLARIEVFPQSKLMRLIYNEREQ